MLRWSNEHEEMVLGHEQEVTVPRHYEEFLCVLTGK